MIFIEMDPYQGSSARRAALAGWSKLAALDRAEGLMALVRDDRRAGAERAHALSQLPGLVPSLGMTTASSMLTDSAAAVRRAAKAVLNEYRQRRDLRGVVESGANDPEPDPVG